jgi:hypothetical protein
MPAPAEATTDSACRADAGNIPDLHGRVQSTNIC